MPFFGRHRTGREGERLAERLLKKQGLRLIRRNSRSIVGEIDLIMRERDEVVFVEVKTRSSRTWGEPEQAVTRAKQQRLIRHARQFVERHKLQEHPLRFDVVAVLMDGAAGPEIRHYRNAFVAK